MQSKTKSDITLVKYGTKDKRESVYDTIARDNWGLKKSIKPVDFAFRFGKRL